MMSISDLDPKLKICVVKIQKEFPAGETWLYLVTYQGKWPNEPYYNHFFQWYYFIKNMIALASERKL